MLKRHESGNEAGSEAAASVAREETDLSWSETSEFQLGEAALGRSRYEEAADHFQAVLIRSGATPEEEAVTRSLLSKALEELSKYDEAYRVIEKYDDSRQVAGLSARTRALR